MNYNPEENNNAEVETPVEEVTQFSYDSEVVEEQPKKNIVFGLISMILGIVSIFPSCCYGSGSLFAIAALVLAIIDKKKNGKFTGFGIAGLSCSIVSLVIAVLWILYFVLVLCGSFLSALFGSM